MGSGSILGEASVIIRATLDKLDADLASARGKTEESMSGIGKITSKIGDSLKTIGKVALGVAAGGIAAVGLALFKIGPSFISAASNLNEALNASKVVFGDASGYIQEFGKTAAETTGLSAEAFNQMAAQTGALLTNFGLGVHEAAEATTGLTQRAADMASIFNTDVSDAMTAVQAGLRGETEPLRRYGVDVSQAAVQAYALANGMVKAGQEMDNETKITARMALIYEQTNKIAGDFVNTSDGLANSSRIQQARWQNFKAELGGMFLPVMQKVQQTFMTLAAVIMPKVIQVLKPVAEWVGKAAEAFGNFITAIMGGQDPLFALTDLVMRLFGIEIALKFRDIVLSVQEFINKVSELLAPVVEAITSFVTVKDVLIALGIAILTVVVPAVVSMVLSMLPIILTFAAIVAAVALLRTAWETDFGGMRTKITEFWEGTLKPWLDWLVGTLVAFFQNTLLPWIKDFIPKAVQFLSDVWTTVLWPAIQAVWNWLSTVLIPFLANEVLPWLATNIPKAIETLAGFWKNTLQPALSTVWAFIKDYVIPTFLDVVTWLATNIPKAIGTAKTFWEETLKPAIYTVWNFIYNTLLPAFRDVAIWLGETIGGVITIAAKFWKETLYPAIHTVWEFMSGDLWNTFQDIYEFFRDTFEGSINAIATAFNGIKDAIGWVIEKAKEVIEWFEKIAESIPAVLLGNSPSPFEISLRGIAKQMKELNQIAANMPLFNGLGATMPALAIAGAETPQYNSGPTSYSATTTIYTNRDPLRVLHASRHLDKLGRMS
jgi:hypothetical protein